MSKKQLFALAISLLAPLGACAPTKQITNVEPAGGFLPQPELLKPGESGQVALVYLDPSTNWASYQKVMLEPVTIWAGPDSRMNNLSPEQRQHFANAFFGEMYNAISQRCQMVTTASPGTVNLRFALVDAEASEPALNTISTYVPQARLLSTVGGYAFNSGAGIFTGSATMEGYATDATTGKLLWEGVDKRAGANVPGTNTFNSWADVDYALKAWAEQAGTRIDSLGLCR